MHGGNPEHPVHGGNPDSVHGGNPGSMFGGYSHGSMYDIGYGGNYLNYGTNDLGM